MVGILAVSNYIKEIAIAGIVILVSVAIYKDLDGVLLATGISAIAGIAGYEIGKRRSE